MQVTIYPDIIFMVNFLTDLYVLYLTGRILKKQIRVLRLILGALFGAGAILPFLTVPSLLLGKTGIIIFIGISMGAVFISFGRKGLIKNWFLSTTIMILLGGIMNYLRYKNGITTLTLLKWLILFTGSIILCILVLHFLQKLLHMERNIYTVEIKNGERICLTKLYLDTGNMLFDPLYGKPVLILSEETVNSCVEEEEREFIKQYRKYGKLNLEKMMVCKILRKASFHEIPYRSVGQQNGKLLCFLADEVRIEGSEMILRKQPVAIVSSILFKGKEYQGLLQQECV